MNAMMPLEEALRAFCRRLFTALPEEMRDELERQFVETAMPKQAGLTWWADRPLMVFEEAGALVVERAEAEKILAETKPASWPPA